ncbi:MAG: site-2 protease family protein [Planctomycetota bacterium]|nr:site-2 protease family protein [Planctomycetota bacterium]
MHRTRFANTCLWVFNALLGTAIIVFLYRFVLFPPRQAEVDAAVDEEPDESTVETPEWQKRKPADYESIWKLALALPPNPSQGVGAGPVQPEINPETLFRLALATVVENAPELGSVVLEKKQGGEQRFLLCGDKWENVAGQGTWLLLKTVTLEKKGEIKEYQAHIVFNDKEYVLSFIEGPPGSVPKTPSSGGAGPGADTASAAKPGEFKSYRDPNNANKWFIDSREREYVLQNEAMVLGQIDMRPYVQDGVTTGMLVSRVDGGSLAEQRGLKIGDVIRNVNGVQVDSFEAARRIMQDGSVRAAEAVTIELERAGQKMQVTFQVFTPP